MKECIIDALLDTIKLIPYLLLTFIVLEIIEHKLSKKSLSTLTKYKNFGPIVGGLFGGFPQCGFSAMASNLYTSKVITMGTLIAVFLSTSDEMLPIMLSENASISLIIKIISFKILVGIIIGVIVDLIYSSKIDSSNISHMCEEDHCHCKEGIIVSSIIHTIKTTLFVLVANLFINFAIYYIGTKTISHLLGGNNVFVYFISSLIGLIPNCASSIVLTEVFVSGLSSLGVTLSGLLTGSGIGILLLFKNNKSVKDNITITTIIYFVGVVLGILVDLIL